MPIQLFSVSVSFVPSRACCLRCKAACWMSLCNRLKLACWQNSWSRCCTGGLSKIIFTGCTRWRLQQEWKRLLTSSSAIRKTVWPVRLCSGRQGKLSWPTRNLPRKFLVRLLSLWCVPHLRKCCKLRVDSVGNCQQRSTRSRRKRMIAGNFSTGWSTRPAD